MEDKSMQGQSSKRRMNAYEKSRMSRIQENQKKLQALGVKNIAKSLTSLAESDKTKKKKNKSMDTSKKDIDVEYMPGSDIDVEQDYQEAATKISKRVLISNTDNIISFGFFSKNSTYRNNVQYTLLRSP
ncbi:hypothetical protein HanRHA438_Chr17g0820481 [Helianthus annuus]|nr:hypothetical protein HanRHA438_Chr17g0820481 [Helianthus annuus]